MARNGGIASQRLAPPQIANGQLPPSTAARIVTHAANAQDHPQPGEDERFIEIVQEYLDDDEDDSNPNPQTNIAVISALMGKGFDNFHKTLEQNPFDQAQPLNITIICIKAITKIIDRKPHLLLHPQSEENDGSPRPPVFLWMFPRLIDFVGKPNMESLQGHLCGLLGFCLDVLTRKWSLWQPSVSFTKLYLSCVDGILSGLANTDEATLSRRSDCEILLPPSSSITEFWPESQRLVALPQGCQRIITSRSRAALVGFLILQSILSHINQDERSGPSSPLPSTDRGLLPWALDSSTALWRNVRTWGNTTSKVNVHGEIVAAFMQFLDLACLPHIISQRSLQWSTRAAFTLSNGLSDLISTCAHVPFSELNQVYLASILTRLRASLEELRVHGPPPLRRRDLKSIITDNMALSITNVCQNIAEFKTMHKDLQLALCLWTAAGKWPAEIDDLRSSLCSGVAQSFSNEQLQQDAASFVGTFRDLNLTNHKRPLKRQKVTQDENTDNHRLHYQQIVTKITDSTNESPQLDLSNLHNSVVQTYLAREYDPPGLSNEATADKRIQRRVLPQEIESAKDKKRCDLLSAFGSIACAGAGCLQAELDTRHDWTKMTCTVCDREGPARRSSEVMWNHTNGVDDWKDATAALLAITGLEEFRRSKKQRILMAQAIRRVFNHLSDPDYLSLEHCSLGQWLMSSSNSTLRELRVASMQALMVFLGDSVPKSVRQKNRISLLGFFQTLSKRDVVSDQETLIMAYGQAARVCGEEELPIIILQLIEYLGHTNTLICDMAYNEIASLPSAFNATAADLFRPYWRILGFAVVKDLRNRPQKVQLVADLTDQTVPALLRATQRATLPHLVLTKRVDILQRMANEEKGSIKQMCTRPRAHLFGILALLICQPVADVEKNALDSLIAVDAGFREYPNLPDWIKKESMQVEIACEILKFAVDQDESRKAQYHRGFHTLAALSDQRNTHRKSASKQRLLESFFGDHILGIMTHFSVVIDAIPAIHPLPERKRCLGAIGEMIALAGKSAGNALPQIRASLQSAMADTHMCDQAFLVWSGLLAVLDSDDLGLIVCQTFALVAQNWDCFSDETQIKASHILGHLVAKNNMLVQDRIAYIPSLTSIPMLSKLGSELARFKGGLDKLVLFNAFSERCNDENIVVVRQALKELVPFLEANQQLLHEAALSEKPFPALPALSRSLLDASVRFAEALSDIPVLCAQCLGLIGALDPYKVETVREKKHILVLSNFEREIEVIDFTASLLERILVKVFHSTTNARAQGYLAYVMQELLKFGGFTAANAHQRPRSSQPSASLQRWSEMPEADRSTLLPFLNSKYMIQTHVAPKKDDTQYPIFKLDTSHSNWLRTFVFDLMKKGRGDNVENIEKLFGTVARVIRTHDLSIATFLLPYAALNVIITGTEQESMNVGQELLIVLKTEILALDEPDAAKVKQCSENVFQILDYIALWLQEKRKVISDARAMAGKTGRGISEVDEIKNITQISCVERVLQLIPAEVISKRAVECGSYARALFHWEQYYRQERQKAEANGGFFEKDELLQHLQLIYAQIDEPDSIEGISAHLQVLNPEQQIMELRKAGRWTAAQSWYEIELAEKPNDMDTQINLLTCLKQSGQYDSILNYVDGFHASSLFSPNTLSFAAEAAWSTGKWEQLEHILSTSGEQAAMSVDFNVGVGRALLALRRGRKDQFRLMIESLREAVAKSLSPTTTSSIHACHEQLVKLHVLYEIEAVSGTSTGTNMSREVILDNLDRRLDVLGAYISDKQYVLGVRRAVMQMSSIEFTKLDIASAWLTTARLARKAEFTSTAFNSVLHAAQLGDDASKIEYSKLMWKDGHNRKAIQNLQGAIASNSFEVRDIVPVDVSVTTEPGYATNKVKCQAQLLLAKWLDRAGQSNANQLKNAYASGIMSYPRWEKGHYYLGRHYNKLLESEKMLPVTKQTSTYAAGEYHKLVIENFVRSVVYGTKYYHLTLPKVLTLWLDLGMEVVNNSPRTAKDKEFHDHRIHHLDAINRHIKRYTNDRMPAYAWYTTFPQIITRIAHPHKAVWETLQGVILKVAAQYPQQALWSLLAVTKATQDDRSNRGVAVLNKLRTETPKKKHYAGDLKHLIVHGQRLTDALLAACDATVEQRVTHVSLSKDLGFSHKLAPCLLVVPIEATMIANLPPGIDSKSIRNHNPFPQDVVTISGFMDDVLVLSSLQRPRKVDVRGSDGRSYGLLCKPKDDLRKDQRLMEFNAMINRALQRDIESSKRRLYIKTYGVTPLNEECGTIEWVEGLKPMRDIIIRNYRQKAIQIDYNELRILLNEACSDFNKISIFTERILKHFPPILYEWFIETFPEPEAWFAARLRYTRSCAVMSIVGHVLGLGDRHGENVLLEEGNGGTFHVDFNCLFDKGLTFEKPELVPFRLTHNMVDAMGPSSVEGPFRSAAELTYTQLRQHEDALITILETFVHDPTADFLGGTAKRKKKIPGVPETPQEVLETVRGKVDGFWKNETVPLSVEGYVDALIASAMDPRHLASMYIGWCAFF